MNHVFRSLFLVFALFACAHGAEQRPNVLLVIADDASLHFGQSYACDWVKTPNIDRLAKRGLVFDNCYVVTSKCAPCRASLLTGRNPWQNEDAANHQNIFPAKLAAFGEPLQQAGYHTGKTGKVWGPGRAEDAQGKRRDFGLPQVAKGKKHPARRELCQVLGAEARRRPVFLLAWEQRSASRLRKRIGCCSR